MLSAVKVILISLAKQAEGVTHSTLTRYILKNFFSENELPMWQWFNISFWLSLHLTQIVSLLLIASLTLVTFPLGIWLASFNQGMALPVINIYGTVANMVLIPFNLWALHKTVGEIDFNQTTMTGLALIELSGCIALLGWWFIYQGNK